MSKTIKEIDIDKIRKMGLRPQVVGCFLYDKQLLFVYKKEHDLWQLPQGGIDNNETMREALTREMTEELGDDFFQQVDIIPEIITEGMVEFPLNRQGSRNLQTNAGEKIIMRGKKYFFFTLDSSDPKIDIKATEFDDYKWVTFEEGMSLSKKIYQKGKKRITIGLLNTLKEKDLIK